jgi:hypothetical protein
MGGALVRLPNRLTYKFETNIMNVLKKSIMLGGCVAALTLCAGNHLMAQGRGGDPAQFRQDRLDRAHDQLEITNNAEWKAVEPLVGKVIDAEREVMSARMGGMFGGGGRGGRRGGGGGDGANTNGGGNQQRQRRNNFFGEPSAAATALQKAIEDKAPASELKAKLAAVRAETKDKEAKLDAAQEDLRSVLTARQEAIAVANGLLK